MPDRHSFEDGDFVAYLHDRLLSARREEHAQEAALEWLTICSLPAIILLLMTLAA